MDKIWKFNLEKECMWGLTVDSLFEFIFTWKVRHIYFLSLWNKIMLVKTNEEVRISSLGPTIICLKEIQGL